MSFKKKRRVKRSVRCARRKKLLSPYTAFYVKQPYTLITGGCGFVGTNLAHRLLSSGHRVLLYDNLSRNGVEENLNWLRTIHGDRLQVVVGDVRDYQSLEAVVANATQVFHFAAQVAVTTSLTNPIHDFDVNGRGTLNLLEALRKHKNPPPLLFTSTNKVYGALSDISMVEQNGRYEPADERIKRNGIGESRPLDFHSPYGCSKGTADQYIIDYARTFNIRAVVFRMSCIYGPHQFGNEDQGWVAHFLIQAIKGNTTKLYGDGKQVRDILFVEDLIDAMLLAQKNMSRLSGQAFNIGGGPRNTISLRELTELIEELHGVRMTQQYEDWRPGDQRFYVSDTRKFSDATNWAPHVSVHDGVEELYRWLLQNSPPACTRSRRRSMPLETKLSGEIAS